MIRAHILFFFYLVFAISLVVHIESAPAANTNAHDLNALYMQQLFANLNTSVDPCEDFYAYACGNWAQNHDVDAYVDVPGYMDHRVNEQLLDALLANKRATNESDVSVLHQAWRYYESCVNLKTPALNAFLRYVQQQLQFEWPILRTNWQKPWQNATQFDWLRIIGGLRAYALNDVFIMQHVNVRLTNGTHYLLELHAQQPLSVIAPKLELQHIDVEAIFINFGLTINEAKNISSNVIALEKAMDEAVQIAALNSGANILNANRSDATNVTRLNLTSLEMNVGDLIELVPQIDWLKYLEYALERPINLKQQLLQTYSYELTYFRQLPTLLAAHTNETIAYYIMLKFMYQLSGDLPTMTSFMDKSIHCVRLLRGYMPLAANYLYEEYYYKHRRMVSDAALHRMYNTLRKQFAQLVDINTLQLNETERLYILDELNGMQLRIGNVPHKVANLTHIVEAYYADVQMNASDFYSNHIKLIHSNVRRMQAKLLNLPRTSNASLSEQEQQQQQQVIYEHDFETASSSSPIKIFDNVVLVPYGYLQLPLYDHRLDALLQYSLFGFILAHEIMHAYDLFHIIYDKNGNFNKLGLNVAHHFWNFINCTKQTELNDVLSENMADVAGLRLAYETYFDLLALEERKQTDQSEIVNEVLESTLPLHLSNLTRPQLFFINSVQFLCANMPRIESLDVQTLDLGHDMHDVRVRRNWPNLEHFATAFQCARDTPMNPQEKCRWW